MLNEEFVAERDAISSMLRAEGLALDPGFRGFAGRSERRCRKPGSLEQSKLAAERTMILHHPCLIADSFSAEQAALAIQKVEQHLVGQV